MAIAPDGTVYEIHGPGAAPAVVLIHGLGLNREIWQWLVPDLTTHYRVIAYDLFGHGDSPAPPHAPSLSLFSDQIAGLLDELGIARAAIAGFSLGGMIARRFAQDHPDRVSALAILNSPHRRTEEAQEAIRARVRQAREEGPSSTVEAALERWFTPGYREARPDMMDLVRSWVLANQRAIYHTIYAVLADGIEEIVAPDPPISAPTLVCTADEDFGNGPEMTEAIAAEIKGAEIAILPGLRHMALMERPSIFNPLLTGFLDRHLLRSGAAQGILHGIRVLDLSRMLSGPYCTMMLADHGAEVIKIESGTGDTSRGNGPFREDDPEGHWAGYFVSLNRSKRSVVLDLKTEDGREAFRTLVASADVLVENFRPGVMERLGLAHESLARINPRLVYAAVRGFGDPRSGLSPYVDWPSYDVVAQAMGGLMSLTGPDAATPTKTGPGVGDIFAGMMMSFGIMAALRAAESTGRGQFVDVAMYDAMISLCERAVYLHDFTGDVPGPGGNGHPFLSPFGIFPARDGAVALGIVDDAFWQVLAGAMDRGELADDLRFATRAARAKNADDLNALVADWTGRHSKAELGAMLGGQVPFGPLNTIADIFRDSHVARRGMLAPVAPPEPGARPWTVAANPLRFSTDPAPPPRTPPRLGEHTDEYLAEMPVAPASDADKRALRDAFGCFATGVTVVTTLQPDGTPRGFTANSFTSVSLDPPLLLICIAKTAHSCALFREAPSFAVNVLAAEQQSVSQIFASRDPDKFDRVEWSRGAAGVPVIEDALASLVCNRERMIDAGDHVILLGRVIDHRKRSGQPLGYFRGDYLSVAIEEKLVSAASKLGKVEVGSLVVRGPQVLLAVERGGGLSIPRAPKGSESLAGILSHLRRLGLKVEIDRLYAVYQDSVTGVHVIFYRTTAEGRAPRGHTFINCDDIDLELVACSAERSLLARYFEERREGSFGIYYGDETAGTVHRVSALEPSRH